MKMECEERDRLTRVYAAFLSDYQRSLEVLQGMTGVMRRDIYRRIKEGAEQARQQSEKARLELDAHLASHHCGEKAAAACEAGQCP